MEVQTCAEMYLKEFERSSELLKVTNHLLKDLKGMYTQLHEEWCRDLQVSPNAVMQGTAHLSEGRLHYKRHGLSKPFVVMFTPIY